MLPRGRAAFGFIVPLLGGLTLGMLDDVAGLGGVGMWWGGAGWGRYVRRFFWGGSVVKSSLNRAVHE